MKVVLAFSPALDLEHTDLDHAHKVIAVLQSQVRLRLYSMFSLPVTTHSNFQTLRTPIAEGNPCPGLFISVADAYNILQRVVCAN